MANNFKNAFKTATDAYQDLYEAPSSTTTVILGLALCNKSASAVTVTVQIQDAGSTPYQVLEQVSIPARTTLEVLAGQKYILETTDTVRILAGTTGQIDATLGIMEIT
ncbi:uncharacterized protein METZ01_LOCUS207072 [marine metagenome]|uniref:Uncharacterized protein n=1 Tax=marine metagenome TaxID=408172 RepID=A0A382EU62_9ZZZZ